LIAWPCRQAIQKHGAQLQAKGDWQNPPDLLAAKKSEAHRKRKRDYLEEVAISAVDHESGK
jgi:hypothetical protein